jgi:hypothetical protein
MREALVSIRHEVLRNMGRLASFARAANIEDLASWVLATGSVVVRTNSYEWMFTLAPWFRAVIDELVICPGAGKPVAGDIATWHFGYDPVAKPSTSDASTLGDNVGRPDISFSQRRICGSRSSKREGVLRRPTLS